MSDKKVKKVITNNSKVKSNKDISKLIRIVENVQFKSMKVNENLTNLNKKELFKMLDTGFFSIQERKAVKTLILKSKINTLNENTLKVLDSNVVVIVESKANDSILTEGFFGDIVDGLKGLGDKAKDYLKAGWSKVKSIWSEFTDLVKEVVSAATAGFKKGAEWASDKATDGVKKAKDIADKKISAIEDKKGLGKDILDLEKSAEYITKQWFDKTLGDKPEWQNDVIKGSFDADDVKADDKTIEAGMEDLDDLKESRKMSNELKKFKVNILSDSNILNELMVNKAKRLILKEGGGFKHLEDSIKNPLLKNVVKYAMQGIQWALIPLAKISQILGQQLVKKGLIAFSEGVNKLGGPGVFKFTILTLLIGELFEIIAKSITPNGATIAAFFIPPLAPLVLSAEGLISAVKMGLLIYTLSVIFINIKDDLKTLAKA